MNRYKVINIVICSVISAAIIALAVLVFGVSYLRFFESCKDLGISVVYYFCTLFSIDSAISPTVWEFSSVLKWDISLPQTSEQFFTAAKGYFDSFFDFANFSAYISSLDSGLLNLLRVAAIVLPAILVLFIAVRLIYRKGNTNHNKDTKPLMLFKKLSARTYQPLKRVFCSFKEFLSEHRWIYKLWIAAWIFSLNGASIAVSFIAWYLAFAVSFDFGGLWVQAVKLFTDLKVILTHFPWWWIVCGIYLLFTRLRKSIALNRLHHFEARNCGFINKLPIVSMACGSMGKKKTTLITDMILSQEVMFRQKALEIIQSSDMKFPHFPWIAFEDELGECMEHGTVYNLATVKSWVQLKKHRFSKHGDVRLQLYGYDISRYGSKFDDALKVEDLFNVLSTYAQAYFIYVIESSLIVSNYSVRTDNALVGSGNFPLWLTDFFEEERRGASRHSHILDFDILRLGRKVLENNKNAGSFEFGVIGITEIGKERGNNLELKEVKRNTYETNQKNDLFNSWLKMCRHSATVDNFPFIKVFTDEQRPESWGADARDLCDVIYINSSGDMCLAMPFYTIEEMFSEWAFNGFLRLYTDFRFRRGDNTLLVHILKSITAFLWRRNLRIYNRYGYCTLKVEKESGRLDGKTDKNKYYLMNAKIYAQRFSTDCFSDYFNDLAKKSPVGLNDYLEYAAEKATVEELKAQNSYFINSIYCDKEEKEC